MQNPVLIIHGSAQLLQGAAVTFDTAAGAHPTTELGEVRRHAMQGAPRHVE